MNSHSPYHISHIYLNEQLSFPALNVSSQGNYIVFWWHDFALGHLFVPPHKKLSKQGFDQALIAAIAPAVAFYAPNNQTEPDTWQKWILDKSFGEWAAWMNLILPSTPQHAIPAKVGITAVVCTRNRAHQLERCLKMLLTLPCRPEEIIVVDNAPSDTASKEVALQFEEVQYVLEPRAGLDIARNTGAMQANTQIVAYVDDDVVVHPLWAYQVWKTFEHKSIAAMTGLVIASELRTEAQYIFEKHWSFNRGYTDILYDEAFIQATLSEGPPVWVIGAGANMAFRKEVFEQVGYFDELLDVGAAGCSGDSEMWYRILMHGYKIQYNPRAIAFHEHRREIKALKKQIFYYMRGHAAAAMIQQQQHQQAGYRSHIFWRLPKQYAQLLKSGFPRYTYRHKTVLVEILGVISGLGYYFKNRKQHQK